MGSNRAKSNANRFIREFGFYEVSLSSLKEIVGRQGYTIIEYSHLYNDENVTALLRALNLEKYAQQTRGFTYAGSNYRLVFLHEDLSEEEKLLVLAHEEGHIYCEHLSSTPIIGKDVLEEHEANEFSHYILRRNLPRKLRKTFSAHRKAILIGFALAALIVTGLSVYQTRGGAPSGDVYVTTTGNKYHKENCIFVKGKTTTRRMTREELENSGYEPCEMCLP